ncbi:MAG: CidA/LrgA family protein [Senegalia sp. (in: firmicutes)]|uniref:CidA/LrgA family protein n=1 Tax=Senegalia sp. (in: firmicutes) TaxID=1924098 RepID=UPI003F9DAA09
MKFLRRFAIILIFFILGELINNTLHIPIPGNIIGMILLFLSLYFKIIKLELIEDVGNFLLDHLAFFFIAPGVALIALLSSFSKIWLSYLIFLILTTALVMGITGVVVQYAIRRGEK